MKTLLAASAASMCVAAPAFAQAQNDTLLSNEIIVTGTRANDFGERSGIPLARMPQGVQVIDNEALREGGVNSLEDALRVVPSATLARSHIGSSTSNTLRLRGYAVQVMRNGMRQRFYEGVDASALSNVERIEVLKGPSGVLYGQSGVGGIVSIITKRPNDVFAGSLVLTAGAYDQRIMAFDVGGPLGDTLGLRLTGQIERSDTFVDHMGLDRENVGLSLVWRPVDWLSAHVVAEYLRRETLNNPGLPTIGTVISNGVGRVSRSTFLGEPDYSRQQNHAPLFQTWVDFKLADAWTLTPRLQYSEFNNRSLSTTLLAPVAGRPTLIDRAGRNAGEEDQFWVAQLDLAGRARLFGLRHELLVGVEYSEDRVDFHMRDNVPCGIGPIDSLDPAYGCGPPTNNFGFRSRADLVGYALYLQDQISLTEAWNLILGVRRSEFENNNAFVTAFSTSRETADLSNTTWQLGSTYDLGGGVSLFGGYSTGYDLEWVIGARAANGAPFQPETSNQVEAGVRLARDNFRLSASVFRIRRNDVAAPDPANLGFQIQSGQFTVHGFELESAISPAPGWTLQGGYAYLDGELSETTDPAMAGARLAETPAHSATLTSRWRIGRYDLRVGANYVGERKMVTGGAITLPDYTVLDIGAGAAFGPVRIEAALTNATDEVYYYSDNLFVYSIGTEDHVLPGDPRMFSVRLSYAFGGGQP